MQKTVFTVTLRNLSPDGATADASKDDIELRTVTIVQLRKMLTSLALIAQKLPADDPAKPEIRVVTPREEVVVRTEDGTLRFVSWDSKIGGSELTVDQIVENIAPSRTVPPFDTKPATGSRPSFTREFVAPVAGKIPRKFQIAGLILAILVINSATVWLSLNTGPTWIPEHEPLTEFETLQLIQTVAGVYETSPEPGGRRLAINRNGTCQIGVYSADSSVTSTIEVTLAGIRTADGPQLAVPGPMIVEVPDDQTVILYGQKFKRRRER